MAKTATLLPEQVKTLGGMLDGQWHITWICSTCKGGKTVDLLAMASAKGIGHSLVDRTDPCPVRGCGGTVIYHYSPGPSTPSRPLQANRERQLAAKAREDAIAMEHARIAYNSAAHRHGRPQLPPRFGLDPVATARLLLMWR